MSAVILAAKRSAVCPSGGAFKHCSIEALGAPVIWSLLDAAGVAAEEVDELILGNALGAGGNPARRVALAAGLSEHVAGLTIDRQCTSGLDALRIAAAMVESGQARVVIAGGLESHSTRPIRAARDTGMVYEQARFTPWIDRDPDMAEAAAALAERHGISRQRADAYAVESHAKALAARARLADEILPIAGAADDHFTRILSPRTAARARPVAGSVSAANMAVSADGAGLCLVAAARPGTQALARIIAADTLGADPLEPGLSALPAIASVLDRAGLGANDLTCIDLMEAFAVQAIATIEVAGFDPNRVNPAGGALARGHPIGASGAIGAVRAVQEIRRTRGPVLAAIPAAGGIGSAAILTPA
ncbi:MAG: thiolase family protein [Pseudomonadota bacterium]